MTPDELRLIVREELLAAGIGEQLVAPPIYLQSAEEIVLGAVLDNQVTLDQLGAFRPDHCCVPWIRMALLFNGDIEERAAQMTSDGWPPGAVEQVRHCYENSPVIRIERVTEAAEKVTELYKRRQLARACRRVACEMEADAVSYEEAVATLRATIVGLRESS